MNSSQKIIKNLAIALGIFLTIFIISMIIGGIYLITSVFSIKSDNSIDKEINTLWMQNNENVISLDIDIKFSNLTIKNGDKFLVESNNKNIKYKYNNSSLEVEEIKYNLFNNSDVGEVIITIPSNIRLDSVDIDNGAGGLNIESINANKFNLDLGAGITVIDNIIVDSADIDSGAGKFIIKFGKINNLDFDMGAGTAEITSIITGNNQINSGVGNLKINLIDNIENYKIKINKGIGKVEIDNKEVSDNKIVGTGLNFINISGGIGTIAVNFMESR